MRRYAIALLTIGLVIFSVMPASAAPPTPDNPAGHGKALGVVPAKNQANHRPPGSANNLAYHGGPVMHTNSVHAIYWIPSGYTVSGGYQSIINGFFTNVASATSAGSTSNVYYSDTQYSDTAGSITNQGTFAGGIVDTNPFPASGCTDSYTKVCLSDAQISAEIDRVVGTGARGTSTLYFMFTPKGVGSCFDASSSQCAFSYYCAYHSWFNLGSGLTLYANMPYADTVPAACDAGPHPNGDDADATINVTSHEHNEAITDQQGSAWFDNQGAENGDKCAWTFGTSLGSTGTGQYNQVIGTGKYYLQREWSNRSSGCVLKGQ